MGTYSPMTKLRAYLDKEGDGAVMRLAAEVGLSHAQISRIASGHRGTSLANALAISKITGIAPADLLPKHITRARKGKSRGR